MHYFHVRRLFVAHEETGGAQVTRELANALMPDLVLPQIRLVDKGPAANIAFMWPYIRV